MYNGKYKGCIWRIKDVFGKLKTYQTQFHSNAAQPHSYLIDFNKSGPSNASEKVDCMCQFLGLFVLAWALDNF